MKKFYRVSNITTDQGLWYDRTGVFTGLIHNELNFCTNNKLPMPFDENVVGYLSATENLQDLFYWFTQEDISKLEKFGFFVSVYESDNYEFYNNHWLICEKTSVFKTRLYIEDIVLINNI